MKIIVIGAGHAGIEAAVAAAKMGTDTTLITIHLETIGQMSCNPSIGGIAKGHLVKEIDALGGVMPGAADRTGIHFLTLNRSKGPAVRATRTQNDKVMYRHYMKNFLENVPNLTVYQSIVSGIMIKNGRVCGVKLLEGNSIACDSVIVTSGTFLNGKIYIGDTVINAGRSNEPPSIKLAENIKSLGFETLRLKTGTPMRVHADSVDFSEFVPQPGDKDPVPFSMFTDFEVKNSIVCYAGYTNDDVKKLIEDNIPFSPLYSGKIEGIGPRYCPSIEDKIVKFPHRGRHHFYLEPEGLNNKEIYVNGLSTSLSVDVQKEILKSIKGLDHAVIMRPAYAIEYDSIDPRQLKTNLESREIENLFFAGQVNGTSGYEEAAAQGLLAGINAVLSLRGEPVFIPGRDEAYMGVMVNDLVNKGVDEPYRLFTSRAEYRLQLREDNAFERLGKFGVKFGLIDRAAYNKLEKEFRKRKDVIESLKKKKNKYDGKSQTLYQMLKIPGVDLEKIESMFDTKITDDLNTRDIAYIEAEIKYEGYIKKQRSDVARLMDLEKIRIPDNTDYEKIDGLSTEIREKLKVKKPKNLREVLDIPGATPASVNAISIFLTLRKKRNKK